LRLLVLCFLVLACLSFLLEGICSWRLGRNPENEAQLTRARAAGRTARFAVAIPALLILLLAVFSASAAYHFVSARADLYRDIPPRTVSLPAGLHCMALSP